VEGEEFEAAMNTFPPFQSHGPWSKKI
jgi:hypothetical protein